MKEHLLGGIQHDSGVTAESAHPSEEAPSYGELINHEVIITAGEYWLDEEGTHVFRSIEFDVQGEGSDEESAFRAFAENVEDLVAYLGDLVETGKATEYEYQDFVKLARRMLEAHARHERERLPLFQLNLARRQERQHHARQWQPAHVSSSRHSLA